MRSRRRVREGWGALLAVALAATLATFDVGCGSKSSGTTSGAGGSGGGGGNGGAGGGSDAATDAPRDTGGSDVAVGGGGAGGSVLDANADVSSGNGGAGGSTDGAASDGSNAGDTPAATDASADAPTPADAAADNTVSPPDATSPTDIVVSIDLGTMGRSCYAFSTGSCLCYTGSPNSTVCNATSVVQSSDQSGVCCDTGAVCTCNAYACKSDSTQGLCTCSTAGDTTIPGSAVTACPSPASGTHCCLLRDQHKCICAPGACTGGEEVPICTPSTMQYCTTTDGTSVATCSRN
jgi:hypothetical protein